MKKGGGVHELLPSENRPFIYSEEAVNRTKFCYVLKNFLMCTIVIEALTPLDRASCIKMYKKCSIQALL